MKIKILALLFSMLLPAISMAWGSHELKPADDLFKALAKGPRTAFDLSGAFTEGLLDSSMTFYAASENPKLQDFIDQIFFDIYEKTTMGLGFCSIYSAKPEKVAYELGVSDKAAQLISKMCKDVNPSYADADPREMRARRQFYFVFNVPKDFPFESWTTQSNQTLIFINGPLSKEEIYTRVIHEVYIAYDAKMDLSPGMMALYLPPMGTLQILGDDIPADDALKKFQIEHAQRISYGTRTGPMKVLPPVILGARAFMSLSLITLPVIKYSLATLRAMSFERIVLSQIFDKDVINKIPSHDFYDLENADNFAEEFRRMLTILMPLQDYLLPYEYTVYPLNQRHVHASQLYLSEDKVQDVITALTTSPLKIVDSEGVQLPKGRQYSLISWLTAPLMNPTGSFYGRGPRPRIGEGWKPKQFDGKLDGNRVNLLKGLVDPSKVTVVPQKVDTHSLLFKMTYDAAIKVGKQSENIPPDSQQNQGGGQ